MSTTYLPPTQNILDSSSRLRLLRSSRKIEHVFGSTPILMDPRNSTDSQASDISSSSTWKPRRLRRQASIFQTPLHLDANTSSSSLASSSSKNSVTSLPSLREAKGFSDTRRGKNHAPTPLVLQLNAEPITIGETFPGESSLSSTNPSSANSHRRSRSASATSMTTPVPTPLTPSFRFRAAAVPAHRRKKLQKLARTLGENVPPSLVFPSHSYSESSAPSSPTVPISTSTSSSTVREDSIQGQAPKANKRASLRRSASVNPSVQTARKPGGNSLKGTSQWQPPFEWTVGPTSIKKDKPSEEEEDSGTLAWGADNYDAVMARLRSLRN